MTEINPRAADHTEYRQGVRDLCARFGSDYWQDVDSRAEYPEKFVQALTEAGWLSALIRRNRGAHEHTKRGYLEDINRSAPTPRLPAQMTSWSCCGMDPEQAALLADYRARELLRQRSR